MIVIKKRDNYSGQDCAELHSPYETVVVTGKNPSPQVILHGFLLVAMKVLNSYEKRGILTESIQCICAFCGVLGFGVIFNVHGKNLIIGAFGGMVSWMVYLASAPFFTNDIGQYFVAAMVGAFFSELLAVIRKCPATIFLVSCLIPLVPGGIIFYTMQELILGHTETSLHLLIYTFEISASIAMGIFLASFLVRTTKKIIHKKRSSF